MVKAGAALARRALRKADSGADTPSVQTKEPEAAERSDRVRSRSADLCRFQDFPSIREERLVLTEMLLESRGVVFRHCGNDAFSGRQCRPPR